jgi:hypothetical protein
MKKLEMKQMEGIEGGIFWGTTTKCTNLYSPDAMGIMTATAVSCCQVDYMFWIRVDTYGCETTPL